MDTPTSELRYEIPPRTLAGTAPELLAELDDMIDSLLMIRAFVLEVAPRPACPARVESHRLLHAWRLLWPFGRHAGESAKRYPIHGSVSR